MQLDRPSPGAARHDELERLVEVLLRPFELAPRNVEVGSPHQNPRQQILLIQRPRGRDRALGQRETRVPVATGERVLHRQLVDVDAKHRRAQLVGQRLADAHMVQHARAVARETGERGQAVFVHVGAIGAVAVLLAQEVLQTLGDDLAIQLVLAGGPVRLACTEERDCSPAFHSFDQLKRKLQSLNLCQRSSSKPQMGSR